jgi:Bardet-Biedl syndrome 1 protein
MLSLPLEEARRFVETFKNLDLKKQVTITCLAKMNKNSPDEDAINCLIVGTEQKSIYILDCEAFTILATVKIYNLVKYHKHYFT